MAVTVNTEGLRIKLRKIQRDIPKAVSEVLEELGYKMLLDIVGDGTGGNTKEYSPSWQSSRYRSGPNEGNLYFSNRNSERGLLDAIAETKIDVAMKNGIVNLNFGSYDQLAELTRFRKGAGSYSDLFLGNDKYNRPMGERAGGSSTHGYLPGIGMTKSAIIKHPGVTPVFMFQDTLQFYRSQISIDIAAKINEKISS